MAISCHRHMKYILCRAGRTHRNIDKPNKRKNTHKHSLPPGLCGGNLLTTLGQERTDRETGLVIFYDIWPGNGSGLFLQPCIQHGAQAPESVQGQSTERKNSTLAFKLIICRNCTNYYNSVTSQPFGEGMEAVIQAEWLGRAS